MSRDRLRRVVSFLLVLGFQFVLFELGMRMYGGSEAAPAFQQLFMTDSRIGHRLRPNATTHYSTSEFSTEITINSAGVRGAELGAKAPGERRIVVLGDSLVLAVQVADDETFCSRLEWRLNRETAGAPYRVINGGVQGYGPVEEWLFYEHVVSALQPDVVVIGVFVANDAIEALDSSARLDASGQLASSPTERAEATLRRLVRQSMVLQTLRLRAEALKGRFETHPVAERPLASYLVEEPEPVRLGLEKVKWAVSQIAEHAAQDGARAAVMLIPARFQVDDGDYGRLADIVAQNGGQLDRDAATERFKVALAPLGLPMLDLLPVLRSQPNAVDLFFKENIHFTPPGHRVVAEALDRFLRDEGLVESRPARLAATVSRARPLRQGYGGQTDVR